ncbi:MAG TPA: hypothetical protein VFE19_03325 [Jatrophihabitantaceae bacterium]|jgi:hypothetical protein|nr:hypothetical protein [Jatrophihabitantaceae bacterium]
MKVHALNMHTDLKISGNADGTVTFTGKDEHGHKHSVTVSGAIARKIHEKAGGQMRPVNGTGKPVMTPFNMHTDAVVRGSDSSVVVKGKAGDAHDEVTLTIDGAALAQLKAANVGL